MDVEAVTVGIVGTGSPEQRRRSATADAVEEALGGARSGRPVVAVRRFGDGEIVVADGAVGGGHFTLLRAGAGGEPTTRRRRSRARLRRDITVPIGMPSTRAAAS